MSANRHHSVTVSSSGLNAPFRSAFFNKSTPRISFNGLHYRKKNSKLKNKQTNKHILIFTLLLFWASFFSFQRPLVTRVRASSTIATEEVQCEARLKRPLHRLSAVAQTTHQALLATLSLRSSVVSSPTIYHRLLCQVTQQFSTKAKWIPSAPKINTRTQRTYIGNFGLKHQRKRNSTMSKHTGPCRYLMKPFQQQLCRHIERQIANDLQYILCIWSRFSKKTIFFHCTV